MKRDRLFLLFFSFFFFLDFSTSGVYFSSECEPVVVATSSSLIATFTLERL